VHPPYTPPPPPLPPLYQICLEGDISRESVARSMARGEAPAGDLIAWTVTQQFQV
jgi:N-acetyltransferase 10